MWRPAWLVVVVVLGCAPGHAQDGAAPDAPPASDRAAAPGWATYTIAAGAHTATLADREPRNPIDGVVYVDGRDYELVLDPSARYELIDPVQPEDQLDWNKLPGLSDCHTVDLSVDGVMFGWRWRPELDPPVLEVTAYANNQRVHLTPPAPLFVLDAADLEARAPLRYRLVREQASYALAVRGNVRGRTIDVAAALPRRCVDVERGPLAWAGAFYFGGTSRAPHAITAQIREWPFVP